MELAKQTSAAFHVTADDPPILIFHGEKDNQVLLGQSLRIQQVYREAKLPITLHILKGSGHGGDEFYWGHQRELMVEFLDKHLVTERGEKLAACARLTDSFITSSKTIGRRIEPSCGPFRY